MWCKKLYLIIAACTAGCIFLSACENSKEELDQLSSKKLGVEEAVQVNINYTLSGKIK